LELKLLIEKEFQINKEIDRQYMLNLRRSPLLGMGVEVVYIYSLVNDRINYPIKEGTVLYIGEAKRNNEPTGVRFQHIAKSKIEGANSVNNYTLTQYYYEGYKMKIQIYKVPKNIDRYLLENLLLTLNLYEFGARPMAQGSTGDSCKIKIVNEIAQQHRYLRKYINVANN
jgi:hypothetical protein